MEAIQTISDDQRLGLPIDLGPVDQCWNKFFSSLAFAELAAATECDFIAKHFSDSGEVEMQTQYEKFAEDERAHFKLVLGATPKVTSPPQRALSVYAGALYSPKASVLEHMAVVHMAFEPAALAYLGFLYRNAFEVIENSSFADRVQRACRAILKDEANHVVIGRHSFEKKLRDKSLAPTIFRSLKRHESFLKLGLKSFFSGLDRQPDFIKPMVQDYGKRFQSAVEGVFSE